MRLIIIVADLMQLRSLRLKGPKPISGSLSLPPGCELCPVVRAGLGGSDFSVIEAAFARLGLTDELNEVTAPKGFDIKGARVFLEDFAATFHMPGDIRPGDRVLLIHADPDRAKGSFADLYTMQAVTTTATANA